MINTKQPEVELRYVCLAGNHSCWAARHIYSESTEKQSAEKGSNLRLRRAWVFIASDLTPDIILVLQGNQLEQL